MASINAHNRPNLLAQTLKGYWIVATLLLVLFIPIVFFLLQKLYLDDVDDGLRLEKQEFNRYHLPTFKIADIATWNNFNRDFKIIDTLTTLKKDTLLQLSFYDTLANELEPYRVLYSPIAIETKPYTLFIKQNLIEDQDWIKNITLFVVGLLAFTLIGTSLLTRWLNQRLWRSFYENLSLLEAFDIDKNSSPPRFVPSHINEFYRLNSVLYGLINKVIQSYKAQREFAENAAHELQTPVAVLKSKIDSFLQLPDLTPEKIQLLDQLSDATTRLSRLNKNLLLLSRLEHQTLEREPCNISDMLVSTLPFWQEQCNKNKLTLTLSAPTESVQMANRLLTETLINNLIINAIRHNTQYGSITIQISQAQFEIRNSSKNSAITKAQLFQRFIKTDASTQGNGLGLAIVKKIADKHSWQVLYFFEDGLHTFRVIF